MLQVTLAQLHPYETTPVPQSRFPGGPAPQKPISDHIPWIATQSYDSFDKSYRHLAWVVCTLLERPAYPTLYLEVHFGQSEP